MHDVIAAVGLSRRTYPANQALGLSGLIQAVLRQTMWRSRLPVKAVAFRLRRNPRQEPGG
jgi:hypothetical protein